MDVRLKFKILPQPTETTCGASCLHALYNYYGDHRALDDVIEQVQHLEEGGTLAVFLACHALERGYSARIYTYNLHVFDPTWFTRPGVDIKERLKAQLRAKPTEKLRIATEGYLRFLELGGEIRYEDLTTALLRKYLNRSIPIIAGLSATYLYRTPREVGIKGLEDDIKGDPAGHFVVLCGYHKEDRTVLVADPFKPNPFSESHIYVQGIDRVVCSLLLGVLTHDANFLVIWPKGLKKSVKADSHERSHSR